jgi:hypothetical protein
MNKFEKSTFPNSRPIGGMMTSSTRDLTMVPKAAPMMMPTAMSATLPHIANSLNSLNMIILLSLMMSCLLSYLSLQKRRGFRFSNWTVKEESAMMDLEELLILFSYKFKPFFRIEIK